MTGKAGISSLNKRATHSQRIAMAMHVLNQDMTRPVRTETLARTTGMSMTNFYKYFKAVTSLTPLQYQKRLRLFEARQMMASTSSVASVALRIGYNSPSQFSREYSRMFGAPPKRDVTVIAVAAAAKGDIGLVAFGIAISVPIVVWGSKLVLKLMDRFPWIITVGAGLLGWIAGGMFVHDVVLKPMLFGMPSWWSYVAGAIGCRRRRVRRQEQEEGHDHDYRSAFGMNRWVRSSDWHELTAQRLDRMCYLRMRIR